jgi:hypothetical protein
VSRPSLVIVLAEDQRHQRFAYRYLQELPEYQARDIRFEPLPAGRGSGERWVLKHYPKNVSACRARAARAETALVVVIDADNGDRNRRVRQLELALQEAHLGQRGDGERIAHMIPRRNIETWILCLNGHHVDEDTDYSARGDIDAMIPTAATVFFQWTRPAYALPEHCVQSLRSTIPEVRRLE